MRDQALRYAEAGWAVIPLAGKVPRTTHGVLDATTDPEQIKRLWLRAWNIGGAIPEGIVVVDEDPRNGSVTTMATLVGEWPDTLTVITGGGGRHRYFLDPGGPLRSGGNALGPGVDLLKHGKYVVLPPSIHPTTGLAYRWIDPDVKPAPLPAWVVALLRPSSPRMRTSTSPGRCTDRYVDAAVTGECRTVAATPQGARNDVLNRASFNLGQLVAAGRLAENVAALALLDAARVAGLSEVEAERTVRSGLAAGRRFPREVPA